MLVLERFTFADVPEQAADRILDAAAVELSGRPLQLELARV